MNSRPPSLKNLDKYEDADLFHLVINSNTYLHGSFVNPDRLVALAFGKNIGSDSVNYQLALAAKHAIDFCGTSLLLLVQKEIGKCLDQGGIEHQVLTSVGARTEGYISTEEVVQRAKQQICSVGDTLYIAHPAQMERLMYLADYHKLPGVPFFPKDIGWNKIDEQLWVTSPFFWVPREVGIRLYDMVRL